MNLILDKDPMLAGVKLADIGCDTVIVHDASRNKLLINAHLKEYKPGDAKFSEQMNAILRIVHANKDKVCILMTDANTQFQVLNSHSFIAYSKNLSAPRDETRFETGEDVTISAVISRFPTSSKVRGPHTAQLDKSLVIVKAVIDHVIAFNGPPMESTDAYVVGDDYNLAKVTDDTTMTTSPISIPDHGFVISTAADNVAYGTLNIKGGNVDDAAWAEFIPKKYLAIFTSDTCKARLDALLLESFPGFTLDRIKSKDFTSKPRMGIFDVNFENSRTPHVTIEGDSIRVSIADNSVVINKVDGDMYDVSEGPRDIFINILLNDLNKRRKEPDNAERDKRRAFFIEKGHMLLNYWHAVQNDTAPVEDTTLSAIYEEWFTNSKRKLPIPDMIVQAKTAHPNLQVVSLQELPNDATEAMAMLQVIQGALRDKGVNCEVYCLPAEKLEKCETRGGIICFVDAKAGGRHRNYRRRTMRKVRRGRKRYSRKAY